MSFNSRYRRPSIAECARVRGVGVYDAVRRCTRLLRNRAAKNVRTRQILANIKLGTYYSGCTTGGHQLNILEGIV
jgi:hypothetical protein